MAFEVARYNNAVSEAPPQEKNPGSTTHLQHRQFDQFLRLWFLYLPPEIFEAAQEESLLTKISSWCYLHLLLLHRAVSLLTCSSKFLHETTQNYLVLVTSATPFSSNKTVRSLKPHVVRRRFKASCCYHVLLSNA